MPNEIVKNAVIQATRQAYEDWSVAHPSLAAVIDQVSVVERAAESLRGSAQYKQAVAAYRQGRNEADLLNQLVNLAGPVIQSILHL